MWGFEILAEIAGFLPLGGVVKSWDSDASNASRGDAQRTWFPGMIAALRSEWREAIRPTELIALSRRMDEMLHRIRSERHIGSPVFTCPHCGLRARAAEPRVTVRATILALGRFEIAPKATVKQLEKAWAKYGKEHGLDLYGTVGEPSEFPRTESTTRAVNPHPVRCQCGD
jgi:hypothetical protein